MNAVKKKYIYIVILYRTMYFLKHVLKRVFYAHQDCIYLMKNTVKW